MFHMEYFFQQQEFEPYFIYIYIYFPPFFISVSYSSREKIGTVHFSNLSSLYTFLSYLSN